MENWIFFGQRQRRVHTWTFCNLVAHIQILFRVISVFPLEVGLDQPLSIQNIRQKTQSLLNKTSALKIINQDLINDISYGFAVRKAYLKFSFKNVLFINMIYSTIWFRSPFLAEGQWQIIIFQTNKTWRGKARAARQVSVVFIQWEVTHFCSWLLEWHSFPGWGNIIIATFFIEPSGFNKQIFLLLISGW